MSSVKASLLVPPHHPNCVSISERPTYQSLLRGSSPLYEHAIPGSFATFNMSWKIVQTLPLICLSITSVGSKNIAYLLGGP